MDLSLENTQKKLDKALKRNLQNQVPKLEPKIEEPAEITAEELEILHANELAEDDMAMACPAIAGDRLLIRTAARVYCIRKGR